MKQTFSVNVNNSYDFNINSESLSELDIITTSGSKYHLLHDNNSFEVAIITEDFANKSYKVKVNNNIYNININNNLDQLIKDLGFEVGSSKKIDRITAPMPGLILEMTVKVGDEVKENDPLLILEAMKMENVITSPRDGTIKAISAKKGDAVDKNQLLVEFE